MSSTNTEPKKRTKRKSREKDEFFLSQKDVAMVKKFKEKIQQMYEIVIHFDAKAEGGQWINMVGEPVDKRNAKNYISAMCNPQERKNVQFQTSSCNELIDPERLKYIERTTNAFIRPMPEVAQFEISGTELAVTLALSQLEEYAGTAVETFNDNSAKETKVSDDTNVIQISPATHNASVRLSNVLQRALSEHSDGMSSADDYKHTRPSVQRVLVNCLHDDDGDDIADDFLFADGVQQATASGTPKPAVTTASDHSSKLKIYMDDDDDDDNTYQCAPPLAASCPTKGQTPTSPGVNAIADRLTETNIAQQQAALLTKEQQYLKSFGISLGFAETHVSKALAFVDEKTRPSDFLDLLNNVKQTETASGEGHPVINADPNISDDDVLIEETETIEFSNNKEAIVTTLKGSEAAAQEMNNAKQKPQIPDGYFERLFQDFSQEDDTCDIEELKRRNAERQRLLKENFQTKKQEPNQPQQGGKKKGKQKNKNKSKQTVVAKSQDNNDMHVKQFKLDSNVSVGLPRDGDDQTCVLHVWGNEDNNQLANQTSPFQTTPKRKGSNKTTQQNRWTEPQEQRHSSPQRNHQQWSLGGQQGIPNPRLASPSKNTHKKPMQVVTPVNFTAGRSPFTQGPITETSNNDIRYIVIDGSNVAMTHGNGKVFSCKGIRICVDYFRQRGHTDITVFVPNWRNCRPSDENPILDQHILQELKNEDFLVFTPSRKIGFKRVAVYDDRFVLELAEAEDAVIVSNDQYRDLMREKATWKKIIEERLLMYSFVKDHFMPPNDPLGRDGPCLDEFLKKSCTSYGLQGNFQGPPKQQQAPHHQQPRSQYQQHQSYQPQFKQPMAPHQQSGPHQQYNKPSASHQYQQQSTPHQSPGWFAQGQGHQYQQAITYPQVQGYKDSGQGHFQQKFRNPGGASMDVQMATPVSSQDMHSGKRHGHGHFGGGHHASFGCRSEQETDTLLKELRIIFPDASQEETVKQVLKNHVAEKDITKLTNYCMSVLFEDM